ncbi:ParA family protein [Limibacter armeniacum]|uniref:ParA family protein n=1 Tax=Limibacter armeniacum TaxID=466084 RepID=UPI002FE5DF90
MTNFDVIDFLKKNPALSLSALEKAADLPSSLLSKVLNGNRVLKLDHIERLAPVLARYGYKEITGGRVISVANNKGGVGKTTTACNLGKALSMLGKKVLLLDMDPQGNLSQGLGIEHPEVQLLNSIMQEDNLPIEEVILEIEENLHICPSDLRLDKATLELQQKPISGFKRLREVISTVRNQYDYIVIDCPPSLGMLTGTSLVASNSVLLTVQPEPYSVTGLENMFNLLEDARDLNPDLQVEGILFTLVNKKTVVHKHYMDDLKDTLSHVRVFDSMIRNNISVVEAVAAKMDIFSYDNRANAAEDYMELAKEISNG